MRRFYADNEPGDASLARLQPEDVRHALSVLRLKTGDMVEIICGNNLWLSEIVRADRQVILVRKIKLLPSTEPQLKITLFQGLPKTDKMDWIVQKATEIGVSRIVPLEMNRCVTRMDSVDAAHKGERWQKIAREAGKQSCRCIIPEVLPLLPFHQLSTFAGLPSLNIVPWEESKEYGPLAFHEEHPSVSTLGILIGPEGGIEEEEIRFLKELGFHTMTLGKRILRTETAGLVASSVMMSLYGEMDRS